MESKSNSDKLAALVVSILIILTALGNATALLIFSILGILAGIVFLRKQLTRGGLLAAMAGLIISIIIAAILLLR